MYGNNTAKKCKKEGSYHLSVSFTLLRQHKAHLNNFVTITNIFATDIFRATYLYIWKWNESYYHKMTKQILMR